MSKTTRRGLFGLVGAAVAVPAFGLKANALIAPSSTAIEEVVYLSRGTFMRYTGYKIFNPTEADRVFASEFDYQEAVKGIEYV